MQVERLNLETNEKEKSGLYRYCSIYWDMIKMLI